LEERYFDKDENGNIIEDWEGLSRRVARAIASIESRYGVDPRPWEESFFDAIYNLRFVPNSPTLFNAGSRGGLGLLSACFVQVPDDSLDSIMLHAWRSAKLFQAGAGVGYNFSNLREEGAMVRSSMRPSSGAISFMYHIFNSIGEVVKQGGRRRAAMMGLLNDDHPEIERFVTFKNHESSLTNFNISVFASDRFMEAVEKDKPWHLLGRTSGNVVKTISAKALMEQIAENNWKMAEPGMIWRDAINRYNPLAHLGEEYQINAVNPCVSGDTLILTSHGYVPIRSVVGTKVEVWNGQQWSKVTPKVTGRNQDMLKVTLSDGSQLRCTLYHGFHIWDESRPFNRSTPVLVEAKDLRPGMNLWKYEMPVIVEGEEVDTSIAYTQGVYAGDGYLAKDRQQPWVYLYGEKANLLDRMVYRYQHTSDKSHRIEVCLDRDVVKEKTFVPFNWSLDARLAWLAGLIDTDGTITRDGGIQIGSINKEFLDEVRLMLTTMGVQAKVTFMRSGGPRRMPDGHGGTKEYETKDCYRLIIAGSDVIALRQYGLSDFLRRVDIRNVSCNRSATQFVRVVSVEPDGFEEEVFCFNEPINHTGTFNGIVTAQCSEATLLNFGNCCLGSINLMKYLHGKEIDWDALEATTRLAVRFLDDVIDADNHVAPEFGKAAKDVRRIGIGVTGFADMLVMMDIVYGSESSFRVAHEVASFLNRIAVDESSKIAMEKGPYPLWDKSLHKDMGLVLRNISLLSIAPEGSRSIITNTSPSIEPNFGRVIVRTNKGIGSGTFPHPLASNPAFRTTYEVPFWAHIKMQSVWQNAMNENMVGQAISKTNNAPKDISPDELAEAYLEAWRIGCKGLTVYRDTSRDAVYYEHKDDEVRDEHGRLVLECATGACDIGMAKPPVRAFKEHDDAKVLRG